jgi:hypothetical protein
MSDDNIQTGNLPSQDDVFLGKSKTPLKSSDTEQILARMQQLVDERSGALNTFQSGWKDASAWFSGGVNGPTAGLAIRDRQKQLESQDTMKMMREMADIRAAEAEAKRYAESQANDYSPIGGGSASAGAATGIPGVTSQNGQYLFRGKIPLSEEEYALARSYRNEADRTKFLESLVKQRSEGRIKWENDPNVYKEEQFTLDGRIRDLDLKTKRQIMAEAGKRGVSPLEVAREYFRHLEGESSAAQPSGVSKQAIAQVETGNRPGLVSPKGAMGVMQVMPNTNRDPGFGVTPARDNSQAELKRVGEDYYAAMQKKYGNDTLAAIAYNMGPGAADTWIKKGGEFSALPKETQNYIGKVHLAQAQLSKQPDAGLSAAPAEVAARPTAQPVAARTMAQPTKPISQMSSTEIKQMQEFEKMEEQKRLAIEQAGGVGEASERGKEFATQATALESASSNAGERKNSVQYIRNQMKNTDVIGILSNATVAAALGTLLKEGIDAGGSKTSIGGLDQAIAQAMKGSKKEDIAAMQNIGREFAKMELTESRNYLKGQGAVSDAERRLITRIVSTVGSSPESIKDFLKITEMRANFDEKAGKAWDDFQRANQSASYNTFRLNSEEFKNLKKDHLNEIKGFTQSTLKPKQSATAVHPGASLVNKYLGQ